MLPHELVARYIVPIIKALIARRLVSKGFSQEKIARLLGVSQPMISKYLRRDTGALFGELEKYGINIAEARSIVDLLSRLLERESVVEYYSAFTSYVNSILARGDLCNFHREIEPRLPPSCDICRQAFAPSKDIVVVEVEEAVKVFTRHPRAYMIIPNVGSNIVAAKHGARSVSEVVGLTGGIIRVGKQVIVIGIPVYGGSRHTAQVLLALHEKWPRRRAAMVIAFREKCISFFKNRCTVVYSGPHSGPEYLLSDIRAVVAKQEKPIDVLADRGGYGLEPVIYVFGESAQHVVDKVIECLNEL